PDITQLRENFAKAADGLPLRIEAFEPFFAAVERARTAPLLEPHNFSETAAGLKLDALLRHDDTIWYGVVPLVAVQSTGALQAALGKPGVRWIDLRVASQNLMSEFRARALGAFGAGALLIVSVLSVGLRSVHAAVRIALPVVVAVVTTAA